MRKAHGLGLFFAVAFLFPTLAFGQVQLEDRCAGISVAAQVPASPESETLRTETLGAPVKGCIWTAQRDGRTVGVAVQDMREVRKSLGHDALSDRQKRKFLNALGREFGPEAPGEAREWGRVKGWLSRKIEYSKGQKAMIVESVWVDGRAVHFMALAEARGALSIVQSARRSFSFERE